jgi:hypothetical protein
MAECHELLDAPEYSLMSICYLAPGRHLLVANRLRA